MTNNHVMYMYAYKNTSEGAIKLKNELNVSLIKHEGTSVRGKASTTIVNWGSSQIPEDLRKCNILNNPIMVSLMVDKIATYETLEHYVRIPDWTRKYSTALKWVLDGDIVLARSKTQGHAGQGIIVCKTKEELDAAESKAKVYCKFIDKSKEYRVHVFNGAVLGYQIRVRNPDAVESSNEVFVFDQGWQLKNLVSYTPPSKVTSEALSAISRSGLLFGAVDIAVGKDNKVHTFEINTAPWLNNEYARKYSDAIKSYLGLTPSEV